MTRYVAFLRAVNVGKRRVDMATAREQLEALEYTEVASFVNSGNLIFTASGKSASGKSAGHEKAIRAALEDTFGFEMTTFVRTATQVKELGNAKPFGVIKKGHTHFVLMTLTPLTAAETRAVEGMSNERDTVVVLGRDVHWLIREKSTETSLGPKEWKQALPDNTTTARNVTMIERLVAKLQATVSPAT